MALDKKQVKALVAADCVVPTHSELLGGLPPKIKDAVAKGMSTEISDGLKENNDLNKGQAPEDPKAKNGYSPG